MDENPPVHSVRMVRIQPPAQQSACGARFERGAVGPAA
jgi:hypothetical protein